MLNILRNIACNEAADIELVVRGIGEARLFSLIEESLHLNRDQLVEHVSIAIYNTQDIYISICSVLIRMYLHTGRVYILSRISQREQMVTAQQS